MNSDGRAVNSQGTRVGARVACGHVCVWMGHGRTLDISAELGCVRMMSEIRVLSLEDRHKWSPTNASSDSPQINGV